jgi:ribosomal protein RSM22 (predicted rRNA methylase)
LQRGSLSKDYWKSPDVLEQYHATFGARIGWKWDAVLSELRAKWVPPEDGFSIWDWGTGSGVAALRVQEAFSTAIKQIFLWDRSALALEFSSSKIGSQAPDLSVEVSPDLPQASPLFVTLSHVLTELEDKPLQDLVSVIRNAQGIIWVEAGTPENSRRLISVRETLRSHFTPFAPCPHSGPCGLLGNTRDWCHQFAPTPSIAFTTSEWRKFQTEVGVDLRSLPVSYLVLMQPTLIPVPRSSTQERMLGRPRYEKGQVKVLLCHDQGVHERRVLKRDSPEIFRKLDENAFDVSLSRER